MKLEHMDKYSKLITLLCNLPLFFHSPGRSCPKYLRNCHHPSVFKLLSPRIRNLESFQEDTTPTTAMRVAVPQGLICPSSQMEIQLSGRTWQRKCIHPATKNNFSMDLFTLRSLKVMGRDYHHFLSTELKGVKGFLWRDKIQSLARGRTGSKDTTGRQTRISQIHVEQICPTDFKMFQYSVSTLETHWILNALEIKISILEICKLWIQLNCCIFVLSWPGWFSLHLHMNLGYTLGLFYKRGHGKGCGNNYFIFSGEQARKDSAYLRSFFFVWWHLW